MDTPFLFVYGTLLIADNEFSKYLQRNSTFHAKGKFKGKLFDAGDYPVAIEEVESGLHVEGSIVKLTNPEITLKHIDPYEGFGEGQPQPYLYIRKLIAVETADGTVQCWSYIYNRSVKGFEQIPSGDYLKYLENKKSL